MASSNEVNSSSGAPVATGGTVVPPAPKDFRDRVSQMIAGLDAGIPDGSSVTVGGQATAKADLVSEMTQALSFFQAVDAAVRATKGARAQLDAQLPGLHKQYLAIKNGLISLLGQGNPQLAQYGIEAPRARKPLTPEQQIVRAEKIRKTRAMRHTMGSVQKKAVQYTGAVEVSVSSTPPPNAPANGAIQAAQPAAAQGTAEPTASAKTPAPPSSTQ